VNWSCGLEVVGGFRYNRYDWENDTSLLENRVGSGTRMVLAAFVNTKECRDAYKIITKKWPVLFQSPVRRNRNSGRDFFFIIYDTR
jgi:hypothetical protein